MSLNANALTDLSLLKTYLGITSASEDTRLELFINAASNYIEKYCDRSFKNQAREELHSGTGSNLVMTRQYPIVSVEEVRISSTRDWTNPSSLVDDRDYVVVDEGTAIQFDGGIQADYANIRIRYHAGYVTIPSDLEMACLWLCEWYYRVRMRQDMGRSSTSKGQESYDSLTAMPPMVGEILDQYKNIINPLERAVLTR